MTAGQNELRMIWLISLVIMGISAWYLELQIVTYLTGLGFLISVMQYISAIEAPVRDLAAPTQVIMPANSKIPLYISSIIAIVGGVTELNWLMGIGITAWIFFLYGGYNVWNVTLSSCNLVTGQQIRYIQKSLNQIFLYPLLLKLVQINHNCWIRSSSGFFEEIRSLKLRSRFWSLGLFYYFVLRQSTGS